MIKRKPSLRSRLIQLSVWPAVVCLTILSMLFPETAFLAFIVLVGGCYGAWHVFIRQNVEFEYILTNGELDVDRITAQRSRKRLLTVDCRVFEILAPCRSKYDKEMNAQNIDRRVDASSSPKSESRWFAIFPGKESKRTILFFEPNQRILDSLRPILPPTKFKKQ
ncbi:MAG: DUF6106 family protein [Oscillospiraceae bacterium]|nr:DUF6106 family protein [Oscillospiraceae bacterium]